MDKNDPTMMGDPKNIEFDYLVENISDRQTVYLYTVMAAYLNSHDIFRATRNSHPFHFTIRIDQFQAQQLLEIIKAYVESHYLQMAGGFHEVKEVKEDVQKDS